MKMGNRPLMKICKIIAIIVLTAVSLSCSRHSYSYIGSYCYNGNKHHEVFCCLELEENGLFKHKYLFDWCATITSGIWKEENNNIILNSKIQDVNSFPIEIDYLGDSIISDTTIFILHNLNWMLYEWYFIFDLDTVKVNNDTIAFVAKHGNANISLFVKSKPISELYQLSLPIHCYALKPPIYKYAKSITYEVTPNRKYSLKIDSIFGNTPLNYATFKNIILTKKRGRLFFKKKGVIMKPTRRCACPDT